MEAPNEAVNFVAARFLRNVAHYIMGKWMNSRGYETESWYRLENYLLLEKLARNLDN